MGGIINLTKEQADILMQRDIEILKNPEKYTDYSGIGDIYMKLSPEIEAGIHEAIKKLKEN